MAAAAQGNPPSINGCPMFPADHIFNTRVDNLPVHPNSDAYVAELGGGPAHPDWGMTVPGGFPMNIVHGNSVPPATVHINWPFTSDSGPFPIPSNAVVGAPSDLHMIVLDVDNCMLYESFDTVQNADGSWTVDAISKFDLHSYALKPADWSSSNAAGTAQLPLLVRYDEVAAGQINHAISMTGSPTGNIYIWPASHSASSVSAAPPMGTRFRLKASYDISGLGPQAQVVAQALKIYGAILTDNGASWHLQGVPDTRFDDADLHSLTQIPGSAFEAVDESGLEISSTSGQVAGSGSAAGGGPAITITPSSGSGATQTFTATFTSSDQTQEHLFFNGPLTGHDACYVIYDRPSGLLYIVGDEGSAATQSLTPGGSGTISSSQCSVAASSVAVSISGDTVTLSLTIAFSPSFSGPKNIYASMSGSSSGDGPWQHIGTWVVTGAPAITINPSGGSGSTQAFVASFTSSGQTQEHLFFNGPLTGHDACYVIYDRASGLLYIVGDEGSAVTQSIIPGGSGTISSSQCTVAASSVSVSISGDTVTLSLTIAFAPSFTGPKNIYANMSDSSYVEGAWQQIGTWNVTGGPAITINPSGASGSTQAFVASFTSSGQTQEHLFFNGPLTGHDACYVIYDRASGLLYIVGDEGSAVTQSVTPGGSGSISSSQCTVAASSVSVSISGDAVTLSLTIAFAPSFTGPKNIYANMSNSSYVEGTWQQIGTWTPN